MPTRNVRDDYAQWLATPPVEGMLVETMEFVGQGVTALAICNRSDQGIVATGEDGIPRQYSPVAFQLGRPAIRSSTEMMVNARVDGMDGALLKLLTGLSRDALNHSLYVGIRVFIDPIMLDRPVWLTPLLFRLEEAKVSIDAIDLTLVGGRLPNRRAGRFYTFDRFIGLRPF